MKQVAPLRYGVIFKKAFSHVEIFKAFVKDVLGLDLEIERVETEKQFLPAIGYVAARFDLYAEDKKNRVIVEIQHVREPDHYDRFLYYHCVAMLEQVSKFDNYKPDLSVYTIVLLTSGDKHKRDIAVIEFDPKDLQGQPLHEMRHKIIYLCPKYINEQTPPACREWLRAIEDTLDEEVNEADYEHIEIRQVFDYIKKDTVSPQERARIIDENQSLARFNKGQETGLKRGLKKGLQQGLQQGLEQGRRETAQKLIAKGLDIEFIAEATGLAPAEIAALQNEI